MSLARVAIDRAASMARGSPAATPNNGSQLSPAGSETAEHLYDRIPMGNIRNCSVQREIYVDNARRTTQRQIPLILRVLTAMISRQMMPREISPKFLNE
eukprot:scaffold271388_cov35-Prasinocladus_malaysianus.AAC.1